MTRHEIREHIFKLIFQAAFHEEEELPEQMKFYFEEMGEVSEKNLVYIQEKFEKMKEKLPAIDADLGEVSEGWKIDRMGKAELAILRLAVYEIEYDEDIPMRVAINEAVELGKTFGGDESPAFINGILAKIVKKNAERTTGDTEGQPEEK